MKLLIYSIAFTFLLCGSPSRIHGQKARTKSLLHFVEANGLRTHYRTWGTRGTPVVLLHGLYDTASVWNRLAPLLASNHRVFAFDRRGMGRSDKPVNGYDHQTLSQDMAAFIEKQQLGSVILIGHSFGGEVALTCAAKHPQLIRALVLLEGGFFPKREADVNAQPMPCKATRAECERFAALEKAVRAYDAEALYGAVNAPVLLVSGAPPASVSEAMLKEFQQHLSNVAEKKLKNGQMAIIKNAGHWIQNDQPRELAKVIAGFVKWN